MKKYLISKGRKTLGSEILPNFDPQKYNDPLLVELMVEFMQYDIQWYESWLYDLDEKINYSFGITCGKIRRYIHSIEYINWALKPKTAGSNWKSKSKHIRSVLGTKDSSRHLTMDLAKSRELFNIFNGQDISVNTKDLFNIFPDGCNIIKLLNQFSNGYFLFKPENIHTIKSDTNLADLFLEYIGGIENENT